MVTRRMLLIAGSSAAVVTAAGLAWGFSRAPRAARQPWQDAEAGFGDPLLDCLGYALLAPNPHNMQPWRIHLLNDTHFDLLPDAERMLPHTDPLSRQITIGMGCFLEVFKLAAAQRGYRTDWDFFPEGEDALVLAPEAPVARVEIAADNRVVGDSLIDQVLSRRTNRAPFDTDRPVSQSRLDAVIQAGATDICQTEGSVQPDDVEALRALTARAWAIEWGTPRTRQESIDVTRIGKVENNASPWGLSLSGPIIEALNATGMLTREGMANPNQQAYAESERFYARACETAMGHLWMTTQSNTRRDQLLAGMSWVRMHLKATELGLGFHPLSQALQEFAEMAGLYEAVHDRLAPNGGVVQMLVRLGYASAPAPAPREGLGLKLVEIG